MGPRLGPQRQPRYGRDLARNAGVAVTVEQVPAPDIRSPRRPEGTGSVITGWDERLVGRTVGSRVILEIPPADGYGPEGNEAAGIFDDLRGQLAQAETRLRGAIPAGASHRVTPRVVSGAAGQAIHGAAPS